MHVSRAGRVAASWCCCCVLTFVQFNDCKSNVLMWKNRHFWSDPSAACLLNLHDPGPSHNYLGLCSLDLRVAPSVPNLQKGAKDQLLGFKSTEYVRTETRLTSGSDSHQETPPCSPAGAPAGDPELCLDYEAFYCPWSRFCLKAQRPVVPTLVIHWTVTRLSVMTKLSHVCLLMLTFLMWVQADETFSLYYIWNANVLFSAHSSSQRL